MKKIVTCCFIMMLMALTGCIKKGEKSVLKFGINFGEMVVNNDKEGIKNLYPGVGDYTSAHLKLYRDEVEVFPLEDDKYKVRYGDGAYIIVQKGYKGGMEVVSSEGIFERATADQKDGEETKGKGTNKDSSGNSSSNSNSNTNSSSSSNSSSVSPAKPKPVFNNSPYPIAPGSHTFNGKASGQYPIVCYVNVASDGSVSGKMGYKRILNKYGKGSDNYMYFNGYFSGNNLHVELYDNNGSDEVWDLTVSDNGSNYFLRGNAYAYHSGSSFSINLSGK